MHDAVAQGSPVPVDRPVMDLRGIAGRGARWRLGWAALVVCAALCACAFGTPGGPGAGGAPDGGAPDAGGPDGGAPDGGPIPPVPPGARVLYTGDRTQSPIPEEVAARLRAVAASGTGSRLPVFMKVGDSISSGGARAPFLACFDPSSGATVNLGGRTQLQPVVEYFRSVKATATETPYARDSLATQVARTAGWAVEGCPACPLQQEAAAVHPGSAVVMFGSNDVQCFGCGLDDAEIASLYFGNLRRIVDTALGDGVVPIVSSMPPIADSAAKANRVPLFVNAARAIAQGRAVPFVDYQREMASLPNAGLSGDGIHPSACGAETCRFDDAVSSCGARWLQYGYNVRNLVTLEALQRVKQVLADGAVSLDASPVRWAGEGTWAAPFTTGELPFTDLRDTSREGARTVSSYACPGAAAAPGPEVVYRFTLARAAAIRIAVLDGATHLDGPGRFAVSLLDATGKPSGCLRSAERTIAGPLQAGAYHLAVDTVSAGGGGEYALVVVECTAGDPSCK